MPARPTLATFSDSSPIRKPGETLHHLRSLLTKLDRYMFHQANMRQGDVNTITIGTQTGKLSLLQIWVETITQELTRLYVLWHTWLSLKT